MPLLRRRPLLLSPFTHVLMTAVLMTASALVWADDPPDPPVDRRAPAPARPQPTPRQDAHDALSEAVRRVERNTQGQVLSAERVPYDGRNVNRIKIVDDHGRVRVYMDDPKSQKKPPTRDDDD